MGTSLEFGFCPFPLDLTVGDVRIETLPGLGEVVDDIVSSKYVSDGWLHAPPKRLIGSFGAESECPYPSRVFGLAKTHRVESPREGDEERSSFLIECLGFLSGMRFTATEAGFLDCTPIKRFAMGDFHCVGADLAWALGRCLSTYAGLSQSRCATALRGVIHSLQMSLRRTLLSFESFFFLYTVFEGLHFVSETISGRDPINIPHGQRIKRLCEGFGLPVPNWASRASDPDMRFPDLHVLDRRNELIHEGLFFGMPLGFAVYGGAGREAQTHDGDLVMLEMTALASRILVALLGMRDAEYVLTPYDTRSYHGLSRPRSE